MLTFIIIYLFGCFLSHMRMVGFHCELTEQIRSQAGRPIPIPWWWYAFMSGVTLMSWLGFIIGVIGYFLEKNKYFFRL